MTQKSAIAIAEEELGDKYVFGAENATLGEFDCSGLVQYAYQKAGVALPRTAAEQQRATTRVSYANAKPGDLVFYGQPAYHVGIYLGDGKFLESPHTGDVVKIAKFDPSKVTFGQVPGYTGEKGRTTATTMATDPSDYVSYGYVQDLATTIPELKSLLAKAAAGGWSTDRFTDALQTTSWWKKNSDTAKKMVELSKADPAEYSQEVNNATSHVKQMAAAAGVPLTNAQIKSLATADLYQGLDDATLQSQIGNLYTTSTGMQGGTAATMEAQVKQLAAAYGVPVTQSWVDGQVKSMLVNNTGIEGATASLTQMASSTYPPLAAQLAAGQTTTQIAQPYIAAMSQTLELPDTSIDLTDPTILKALQGNPGVQTSTSTGSAGTSSSSGSTPKVGAPINATGGVAGAPASPGSKGAPATGAVGGPTKVGATPTTTVVPAAQAATTTVPLWQFTQQLKQDPRWQQTDNAKQSAFSMLHSLGNAWGFST